MNNICVKYLMRLEKPDLGEVVLRLFMRDDANIYEMQNQWYIIDAAKSFLKQRNFESGLRHLDFIAKQFIDFQSNEFDFHTYCLRRWTLREYTELIEFNDNIYDNKKYAETAGLAILYLKEYEYKLKEDEAKSKLEEETKEEK
jgi:peptide alpha-N-acetyltransferase